MDKILKQLAPQDQKNLAELKKNDPEIYQLVLNKLIRLKTILASGNLKLWQKVKKQETENMKILLAELQTEDKLSEVKQKIKAK